MKNIKWIILLFLLQTGVLFSQNKNKAFQSGEFLKFRVSYGLLNAGIATLELSDTVKDGVSLYHAKGIGYTTGVPKLFFKVYDDYQSYFEIKDVVPHQFVRKIDEGGYTKDQEGFFNYSTKQILVKDYKNKKEHKYPIYRGVQDIVSAFYYLRNSPGIDKMKKGEYIEIDMFFDDEIFKFQLKFLGKETLRTKFGQVATLKFRPYVMAGRVFKEKESLTVWISADQNKVPLRIKASLAVGSLKADLEEYDGLVIDLKIEKKK